MNIVGFLSVYRVNINKGTKQVILNQNLTFGNERQLQKMNFVFERFART